MIFSMVLPPSQLARKGTNAGNGNTRQKWQHADSAESGDSVSAAPNFVRFIIQLEGIVSVGYFDW